MNSQATIEEIGYLLIYFPNLSFCDFLQKEKIQTPLITNTPLMSRHANF